MPRYPSRFLFLLIFLAVPFVACDGGCGCGAKPVAELVEGDGKITRDFSEKKNQWSQAEVGATFAYGDALKTGPSSRASAAMASGGGVRLAENTVVRFLPRLGSDKSRVGIELGEADVTTGSGEMVLVGAFGAAVIDAGSRLRVNASDGEVTLELLVGGARIEREGVEALDLVIGEEWVYDVELGAAVVEEPVEEDREPETGPVNIVLSGRGPFEMKNAEGSWEDLPKSTQEVPAGSTLRVRRRGSVTALRGGATATAKGPMEIVVGPANGALIRLVSGGATTGGTAAAGVAVPGGVIVADARGGKRGTSVRLRGQNAFVEVDGGEAALNGTVDQLTLRTKQSGTLTADGRIDSKNKPPAVAHLSLPAGASATVHDPSPPAAIRLGLGTCEGEALVEVGPARRPTFRAFGKGSLNIPLRVGSNPYTVRCVVDGKPQKSAASGRFTLRRDAGRGRLPTKPSRSLVDTDGRKYTLLYQNHLPIVIVKWPRAPVAQGYTLNHQVNGVTKKYPVGRPSFTLESGQVDEGVHKLWYEAKGPANISATTTLTIRYDNAASGVNLREPAPKAPITGESVRVSGVVLKDWKVSVMGKPVPLDGQYRFAADVPVPKDLNAIWIKLTHPRSGVHYYLRKAGGAN